MTKHKYITLLSVLLLLPFWGVGGGLLYAQNIRYVCNNNNEVTYTEGGVTKTGYHVKGAYKNDGKSWATAKENIQDAINDLVANKLTGEVWVAEGIYSPTESTESSGGSTLYMSFKIPAGITVRGGFKGMLVKTEGASPATADNVAFSGEAQLSDREMNSATSSSIGESTKYRSILTGSLQDVQDPVFTWNATKGQFDTQFYGNCYHVVTFATNGFDADGRAKPLIDGGVAAVATELASKEYVAKLEGFVVQNGNAKNSSLDGHPHNAYGGGVYMVPGSMVENIYFTHCEASRDGGAIYMDGGGIVRHCYVADCQALGVDLSSGYGGGICVDENKQIYPPQVTRSTMVNCVGRYGGGMASKVTNTDLKYPTPGKTYDMRYNIGIGSNLIANCTATTEGGGAYSYQGGAWTQMTIVNNKCMGSGVTINGIKTGQSAGMYVRDAAIIANSIFWGGETKAAAEGQSAQFASSRSTKDAKIELFNVALNNSDHTNWSGTVKDNIIMLSNYNSYSAVPEDKKASEMADAGYPVFHNPSATKGHEDNAALLNYIPYTKDGAGNVTSNGYDYKMAYSSAATFAGVLTTDRDTEKKTPAKNESYDILGDKFSSFPTLGAYVADAPSVAPSIEWTSTGVGIAHVYVDPNANYIDDEHYAGSSWATPIKYLRDAFIHINDDLPGLLSEVRYTVTKLQIHVKAGTVDMNGSKAMGSVRASSLVIPSTKHTHDGQEHYLPIEVLGSYDESLTYTPGERTPAQLNALTSDEYRQVHGLDDPSKRNPIKTPTVISGSVLNDYKYNIAHLFKIEDRGNEEITIDGFYMRYGNALSTELYDNPANAVTTGAAFSIKNSNKVTIKNVKVSDCQASNGAAVYATGSNITFENCIFHNNATTYSETSGNIYCDATSRITLDHCDILRNVGYPFYNLGTVKMDNSIVYANMSEPVPDTNSYGVANDGQPANANDKSLVAFKGAGSYTSDHNHNLFDLKSKDKTPMSSMQLSTAPWLQFNFDGGSNDNYPFFCNPTKNAGISTKGDDTYYGREASFQPHNGNPAVNNASFTGDHTEWGTDMSTVITRDYGGMPDIGAIENHRATRDEEGENAYTDGFPAYGTQWYVRDYGSDLSIEGRDGMSWATAINGNGLYGSGSATVKEATAQSWEILTAMTTGQTKTVILANPHKNNGYVLGYNGTSVQGYGNGFANSTAIVNMASAKVNDDNFKFTLTKTDAGYTLTSLNGTKSPNRNNSSVSWGDAFTFTLPEVTGYGSTSDFMSGYNPHYTIRFAQNGSYLNAGGGPSSLRYAGGTGEWSVWYVFEVTEKTVTQETEGLQYAVNMAHDAFVNSGGSNDNITEVWVGAGTYSRDNATNETSCFIIQDGVKVYGAFPKEGNPGKEQREVLCSQYVKEIQGRTTSDFETILQPKTNTKEAGATRRVLGQPYTSNPVNGETTKKYLLAEWDGFTLRNGALDASALSSQNTARVGGAAAVAYDNVTLRNMVAVNNTTFFTNAQDASNLRAGGIYIDGGVLESSYVISNSLESRNGSNTAITSVGNGYGGGLFIQQGTVYNSVIANNTIKANNADGAGTAVYTKARYFNNTVAYNKAEGNGRKCGGIAMVSERVLSQAEAPSDTLTVYNTIAIKNEGYQKGTYETGYKDFAVQLNGRIEVHNCATEAIAQRSSNGRYVTFTACQKETDDTKLFVIPKSASAQSVVDWNLRLCDQATHAINHGINATSINGVMYDFESFLDMDNKDRILDCTVDIGAFEYDNAYAIIPDLASESGRAIYYVTPDGHELASATDPNNAACAAKLQKVLDAAGRYKYEHPTIQTIVKVATRRVGSKTSYVRPGSIAVDGESKDDLNAIKNYKQYLTGLKMVIENLDGTTTEKQVLSGLTCPTNVDQMYVLGNEEINIYAGKKVTFKYEFSNGHGKNNTDCIIASVWLDTNADKIFNHHVATTDGQTIVGNKNTWNPNSIFDAVTYVMPDAITNNPTRIRIRLESSYMINYTDANGQTNRMVYDIPIKVLNGTSSPASFQYYANRTVNDEDQDIRMWSIIVPRGVEVWGGYSDTYSTSDNNGFFKKENSTYTELRDILDNPVYFDASYYNKIEGTNAVTYHVVSFADKVFDGSGNPYHEGDVVGQDAKAENANNALLTMTSKTSDRAVVDGIFIQGGDANANAGAASGSVNVNQYGGAAVVTDYAHVRNCIVRNNNGIYGGAFALTHNALISGTLMEKNSADYGGAVYVFEDGVKLSDGTTINTGQTATSENVAKMPRIYTSTIVNNSATKQGGGLWFTDNYNNVRVNSTLLWQNQCNDEANVYGDYSPIKAEDDKTKAEDFFPFAYSAVQNMRLSGTNNQSVETSNANGIRIWKDGDTDEFAMASDQSNFSDFGYWRPTTYSVLLNTGMPIKTYESMISSIGLASEDFSATNRSVGSHRSYVDIGARALEKPMPNAHLMIRLFVAKPEDVNMNAAAAMMKLDKTKVQGSMEDLVKENIANYYRQEGSSFAYPFQSLQDALDYIVACRGVNLNNTPEAATTIKNNSTDLEKAVDVPFEIFVAKGEYYPTKDIAGNYGESLSNTFALPEGVAIYGGFDCLDLSKTAANTFYGGYQSPKTSITPRVGNEYYNIWNNVVAPTDESGVHISGTSITFADGEKSYNIKLEPTSTLLSSRPQEDVNKNSIIEPWEFTNQTVLSGNTTNESADGVYHVVSILPDENVVGQLPPIASPAGYNYYPAYATSGDLHGYQPYETGQEVVLNGLTISDGYAEDYKADLEADPLSQYIYFKGGGLVADGNRYNNSYNEWVVNTATDKPAWTKTTINSYKHGNVTNNVAYHNIPITIANCKFRDNEAGFGGAIATNCELNIFGSSFEDNLARAGGDTFKKTDNTNVTVEYPGQGGAILCSYQLAAYNTLFANNEAQDSRNTLALKAYKTYNNQNPSEDMLGGAGGAIYMGKHGFFHLYNCDIVRNKANAYPAVFTANPNYLTADWNSGTGTCMPGEYNAMQNTVVWGNELNSSMTYSAAEKFAASLICNLGKTDRNGADYSPAFTSGNIPTQADLTADVANSNVLSRKWMETAWYCAYENGRGLPAVNQYDMRSLSQDPGKHVMYSLAHDAASHPYQNCNIIIDSENGTLEGPNFGNPSPVAGNAGYREDSDWSPARLCNLTDNGSGKLNQKTNADGEMEFYDEHNATYGIDTYSGSGLYWQARYSSINDNSLLPIGNEVYMTGAGTGHELLRISLDPNPTHGESYIDIGVYEYEHHKLTPYSEGDEVDILWVSTEEKYSNGAPDGHSWETPTSDLQRAIETLLASRNGHRKEIRLMDGEYSPIYTINGHLSFYIDTKYMNGSVVLPKEAGETEPKENLGVKSFTIKGGYSKELLNQYDMDLYPAVIKGKARTSTTGDQWDHAIYIGDATQRYGIKTGYTGQNGYGWWETSEKQNTKPAPQLIPIEIDGVTVINNQASAGAKGAAIFYADQAFDANGLQTDVDANVSKTASGTTPANISVMDVNGKKVVKTYYTDASKTATTTTQTEYPATYEYLVKDSPVKLILTKTKVYGSGAYDKSAGASAVYVGKYGGEALIYNNVFHSNYGDPLEAYNAQTVNNTFALNAGKAVLKNQDSYKSTIFNSAFWKNASNGDQFQLDGLNLSETDALKNHGDIFSHNAYTGGNTEAIEYGTTTGNTIHDNNYNVGLIDNNTDAIYGPNFTDPENTDISKRSFKLAPSMRLLNRGENALYANTVKANTSDVTKLSTDTKIYDYAWLTTTEKDAASSARVLGISIDLGAYEYQSRQYRVLYVDPNKMVTTANDKGTSWDLAFGYGKIQAAIDLAALYYKDEALQTYVFVKSASPTNSGLHSGETLTFRNGVSVFGNVDYSYLEDCAHNVEESGDFTYVEQTLNNYVKNLRLYHRSGIVSPLAGHTRILGINTNGTEFSSSSRYGTVSEAEAAGNAAKANPPVALIDGFDVTATTTENPTGTVTEPVINIRPLASGGAEPAGGLHMAVRNVVVHDNDASESAPAINIANVNNALLYGVLFHSNKVAADKAVLNLNVFDSEKTKNHGYAVNCTVEGKTVGADGSTSLNNVSSSDNAVTGNTASSHVYNSITNYTADEATYKTLSGYCYKMEDNNLNYQLTEKSQYIDACEPTNSIASLPTYFSSFINFTPTVTTGKYTDGDLDLLGNFRLQTLGNLTKTTAGSYVPKVDRGAFETWKVIQDVVCVYPDYPHDGSVEYIMEGKNLVIDPVLDTGDNRGTPHFPGFILVQDGGSLYGNGRSIMASYVAVERSIGKVGNIVALPYKMDYTAFGGITDATHTTLGVGMPSYDTNGALVFAQDDGHTAESYNGLKRSAWDCDFTNSQCWDAISAGTSTDACQGIYYKPNTDNWSDTEKTTGKKTYRFVARGISLTDYIYREEIQQGEKHQKKDVTLTQYDDRETTNGAADITSQEDMGWNCIGIPYLVSNYQPYNKVEVTANKDVSILASTADAPYSMDIPHKLWLYYDGKVDASGKKVTPKNEEITTGEYYSVDSWSNVKSDWHIADSETPRMWVGEGFFTQTAAVSATEPLTFYLPVYNATSGSGAKHRTNTRCYFDNEEEPTLEEKVSGNYSIGVNGRSITVKGLNPDDCVRAYTVAGIQVYSGIATERSITFDVDYPAVYIITVNHNSYSTKVLIKKDINMYEI